MLQGGPSARADGGMGTAAGELVVGMGTADHASPVTGEACWPNSTIHMVLGPGAVGLAIVGCVVGLPCWHIFPFTTSIPIVLSFFIR